MGLFKRLTTWSSKRNEYLASVNERNILVFIRHTSVTVRNVYCEAFLTLKVVRNLLPMLKSGEFLLQILKVTFYCKCSAYINTETQSPNFIEMFIPRQFSNTD